MPKSNHKKYKSILIVCSANTCRSPMAEAMLKKMIPDGIEIRSAGVSSIARNGGLMSLDARLALDDDEFYDEFFENFRTTSLRWHRDLIEQSDLILSMTREQKDKVLEFEEAKEKEVFTLKEFVRDDGSYKSSIFEDDISDPFGEDDSSYLRCREEIERCLKKVMEDVT
ncbi:MAG: low molecular weight protein arginine phosphatase [Candidatus Methanolliviera hydrocarbonicum]|uniref:Low molecular weight protein arginine phosphatase n=1 Tax=Candidatus Methanolliviera hydrocarbonicum TaxID=2491085 RepID=A0A520KY23_9EURY|nr:MAG: low molecular weight protein arginine phosphatase [Candidatus Methanolliviera hydrocarbonicum]